MGTSRADCITRPTVQGGIAFWVLFSGLGPEALGGPRMLNSELHASFGLTWIDQGFSCRLLCMKHWSGSKGLVT